MQVAPPPLAEAAPRMPMAPGGEERMLAERRASTAAPGDLVGAIREAGQKVLALAQARPELAEEASEFTAALSALLEKASQPAPAPEGPPPGMAGPPMPPPMV